MLWSSVCTVVRKIFVFEHPLEKILKGNILKKS